MTCTPGLAEEFRHFRVDTVDHVDLTRLQGRVPRGVVVDDDDLDTIIVAAVRVPVGCVLLERVADARLFLDDLVRSGADAGIRVVDAALGLNHEVIVCKKERQVGVRASHRQDDVVAISLDVLDALHDAKRAGLGVFVRVTLERGNHVVGGHVGAVMELHALTDRQSPFGAVGVRGERLGKARLELVVGRDRHDRVAPLAVDREGHRTVGQTRIERVGGFTAAQTHLEDAALLGLLGAQAFRQHRGGDKSSGAEGSSTAKETAAAEAARVDKVDEFSEIVFHSCLPEDS